MKLLFLANRFPYPPYRGDKLKIFHLARRLAAKGHRLHLLTFVEDEADRQYEPVLREFFEAIHLVPLPRWKSTTNALGGLWDPRPLQVLYFRSAALRQALDRLLEEHRYDAVHVQHLRMAPYLAGRPDLPRILDLPDAFSLYWKRREAVPRGLLTRLFEREEQRRVLRYERAVLPKYNRVLTCSTEDLAYLKAEHGLRNLGLLPNGVDLDAFRSAGHDYSRNDTLLFTGNMDYAPNVDAVVHFVRDILPRIHAVRPEVRFVIAGQRPVPKVLELASDRVAVTGFVKDLAPVYDSASVVVAPLRFGAGTQNKVLEALAMGVPVVCTGVGFAGLGIESGTGAILRTEPEGFAEAVLSLLERADLRQRTGELGAALIRERFGWDAVADQLEAHLREVAAGR